ncbi:unnamed protein product [Miscanthus lutarioriparius]|uniref:Uncharacterized protein n=1 Tax=Miscanthus lutarioriparius TaxID=422564 RepID=A0A811RGL1_9POAL|nr:unnamed protein product [Miscanthus lutarioriparius]
MVSTLCSPPPLLWFVLFVIFFFASGDGGPAAALELDTQAAYLAKMKEQFPGPGMSRWWDFTSPAPDYCSFHGVACDRSGNVTGIDVTSWRLVGRLPPGVCAALPALRELRMAYNDVRGGFPLGVLNCTSLEVLNLSFSGVSGAMPPDLSPLRALRVLDLSNNLFTGAFPTSIANVTSLEVVNLNQNPGFDVWRPAESLFVPLRRIRVLILSTTSMRGGIPASFGNMTSLTDLELSGNYLTGTIPVSLARLPRLQFLELYYNELEGGVPAELGNLTQLTDIDLSENRLTGSIPESLCALRNLRVLQIYTNRLTGPIPAVLGNSTQLRILSVYRNQLTGEIPANLGRSSDLNVIEVSENQLTGPLPPYACVNGKLQYILVLSNLLTGPIPPSYAECTPLLRFRVSNNHLEGDVPPGIFGLPHASIVDLNYNHFTGPVAATVAGATNLTSLFASNNQMSGVLPAGDRRRVGAGEDRPEQQPHRRPHPGVRGPAVEAEPAVAAGEPAERVHPRDARRAQDPERAEPVGQRAVRRDPGVAVQAASQLAGLLQQQPVGAGAAAAHQGGPAGERGGEPGAVRRVPAEPDGPGAAAVPAAEPAARAGRGRVGGGRVRSGVRGGDAELARRWVLRARRLAEQDGALASSPGSSASYDVTSFHKLTFDQHEILEALIDKNIVGHGGSGTVYKIELSSGELVAVKKLWVSTRRLRPPSRKQYAYSSKATTKCDVYSFGVVLMELATGRKPIEPEFGDTRDIVHWVSGKVAAGAGAEADALDKRLAWSPYKEEMVQALRVAVRCTCSMPALRPTMADVVQMLAEAGPPAGRTTKNDKDDKDHHHATPPP